MHESQYITFYLHYNFSESGVLSYSLPQLFSQILSGERLKKKKKKKSRKGYVIFQKYIENFDLIYLSPISIFRPLANMLLIKYRPYYQFSCFFCFSNSFSFVFNNWNRVGPDEVSESSYRFRNWLNALF